MTGARWRVKEFFEVAESQLGMAQYEAPSVDELAASKELGGIGDSLCDANASRREACNSRSHAGHDHEVAPRGVTAFAVIAEGRRDLIDYQSRHNKQTHEFHRNTWLAKHLDIGPRK